jgi:hypothetical protein
MPTEHFESFYAKLETDPLDAAQASVVSMQVTKRRVHDNGDAVALSPQSLDWAGLAELMSDDDLTALKAAVDAEVTSRGI